MSIVNILYRKVFGVVEAGTLLLLFLAFFLLDPSLYAVYALALLPLFAAFGAYAAWSRWKRRRDGHRTIAAGRHPPRVDTSAGKDNDVFRGVVCGRRRLQLVGVRIIEGRLELFHILVSRDQESWLVWRTKEQIFALRKQLCSALPGVSVPQLPSALSSSAGIPLDVAVGGTSASMKRHQDLVRAWLEALNDTPVLRDRAELAEFLDDRWPKVTSLPHPLAGTRADTDPRLAKPTQDAAGSRSKTSVPTVGEVQSGNGSAAEKSAMKRIKAMFSGKKSRSDAPPPGISTTINYVIDSHHASPAVPNSAAPVATAEESAGPTYESWLLEKQRDLGFSGDSYESLEFTDISDVQRALFKNSGADNGFKLRGEHYKTDGKKVPAGQPLSRLVGMESYRVDVAVEGKDADGKDMDRHDHVATRGVCRRRIEAALCLRDPPFLFIMNFQLPGDPPVSMVSYFALPGRLARNLGTVSSVPECFQRPVDETEDEPFPADVLKAMRLFEMFCDFPKNEFERLALWGIEGDDADKEVSAVSPVVSHLTEHKYVPNGTNSGPDTSSDSGILPLTTDNTERDSSVCSDYTGTTGLWSASQRSAADFSASESSGALPSGRRYQKAMRREAEAREKEARKRLDRTEFDGSRETESTLRRTSDSELGSKKSSKKNLLQRLGLSSKKTVTAAKSSGAGTDETSLSRAHSECGYSSGPAVEPPPADCEQDTASAAVSVAPIELVEEQTKPTSDAKSVASDRSGASKKSSTSRGSKSTAKGGWKMPSDICWADPHEKGVYPPDDVRNKRFKLTPRIVDGPWVVKAAVPTQPAILGQKVVIKYFRGNGYVEADIYVGSSIIASQVVGLLRGYAKHFVSEVGVTLQGENEDELPEKLFASIILVHPDPAVNRPLDE